MQLGSGDVIQQPLSIDCRGRRFFTRCHLSVCNMHYPPLAGIDYVSKGGKKNDQELYRLVCISGTRCSPRRPQPSLYRILNAAQHGSTDKYAQPSVARHSSDFK